MADRGFDAKVGLRPPEISGRYHVVKGVIALRAEPLLDLVHRRIQKENLFFPQAVAIHPPARLGARRSGKTLALAGPVAFGAAQQVIAQVVGQPPVLRLGAKMLDIAGVAIREVALAIGTDAAVHGQQGAADIRLLPMIRKAERSRRIGCPRPNIVRCLPASSAKATQGRRSHRRPAQLSHGVSSNSRIRRRRSSSSSRASCSLSFSDWRR